ncbi:MAG: hypothetical protein ABIH25_01310 [Candidatus Woesearchaeota archaeon]
MAETIKINNWFKSLIFFLGYPIHASIFMLFALGKMGDDLDNPKEEYHTFEPWVKNVVIKQSIDKIKYTLGLITFGLIVLLILGFLLSW